MGDAETPGEAGTPTPSGRRSDFVGQATTWLKQNARETIITAVIAFSVGWFINVYVVAVRYEGTNVGSGGTATVASNWGTGSIFWLLLAAVVTTLISYGRRVGPARLGRELQVLPRNLVNGFGGGQEAWALLLVGAALSLVVSLLFGAAAAGVSGLALLVVAASPLVVKLGQLIRSLGMRLLVVAAGDDAGKLGKASSLTSVLGAALGMAISWQLPSVLPKVILAVVAVGVAVMLVRGGGTQTAVTLIIGLLAGLAIRELFHGVALADDGGWQEGGGTLTSWWGSQGAATVMANSTVAGGMSGVGSVAGTAAGQVLASSVSDAGLGGLSGEWGAQDAGVEVVSSAASSSGAPVVAPPVTGEPASEQSGQPPSEPPADGATDSPAADAPGADPAGDDASLGGLSGQWGETPPSGTPPTPDGGVDPATKPLPPPVDGEEGR